MFERFRIKTALRKQVIGLRDKVDAAALIRAEDLYHEPAYVVADDMKRNRWSAEQAMVFMVTDVLVEAEAAGNMPEYAAEDPLAYAALHTLYDTVVAYAERDPALAARISRPADGRPDPFAAPLHE